MPKLIVLEVAALSFLSLSSAQERASIVFIGDSLAYNAADSSDIVMPRILYGDLSLRGAEIIHQVEPQYPEEALKAIEGTVSVKLGVDTSGKVKRAVVLKSSDRMLNKPTLHAAMQWRFKPASWQGRSIETWVAVPFRFGLGRRSGITSLESFPLEKSLPDSIVQGSRTIKIVPRDSTKGFLKGTIEMDGRAFLVLRKMTETYKNLKSYHFEGTQSTEMTTEGMHNSMEVPFVLAGVRPAKSRVEMKNSMFGTLTVSDGETTWTYMGVTKQYTKESVVKVENTDSSFSGDNGGRITGSGFLGEYTALVDRLKRLKYLREESLIVAGRTFRCDVIEVETFRPPASTAGIEMTMKPSVYWVEKTRGVVLRDSSTSSMKSPQMQTGMDVVMTKTFKFVNINEAVPDSLFSFTPPEGAKEVEEFNFPGMKRDSLSGTRAKSFTLQDLQGKNVSLESLRGKVVMLDFWATWCGPCRAELPHIQKLHKELQARGLVVLGINDEAAEVASRFMKEQKYTFATLVDVKREVASSYHVNAIPTVVIIDKEGNISAHFVGARSEQVLRKALEKAGIK